MPRERQFAGELLGDHGGLEMHVIVTADDRLRTGQATFNHCLDAG
jgi:hypothetical protein